MALSTVAVIETAVTAIFTTLKDAKERDPQAFPALQSFWSEVVPTLRRLYAGSVAVTVTDTTDAGPSEAIAATGQLGLAYKAAFPGHLTFPIGKKFITVSTTADFTGNELATAKGTTLAAGDIFQVTGADAVTFLGTAVPDFTADETADF